MKKTYFFLTFLLCFALSGCCLNHTWQDATCETPKTCSQCQKTEGEALGHTWETLCEKPETCTLCGKTQGEVLEHSWQAICGKPETCTLCGNTQGDVLEHNWMDASCEAPKYCLVCAVTEGDPLPHVIPSGTIEGEPKQRYLYSTTYTGRCTLCGKQSTGDPMQALYGHWNCVSLSRKGETEPVPEGSMRIGFQEDAGYLANQDDIRKILWDPYAVGFQPDDADLGKDPLIMNLELNAHFEYETSDPFTIRICGDQTNEMTLSTQNETYLFQKEKEISEYELQYGELLIGTWEGYAVMDTIFGVYGDRNTLLDPAKIDRHVTVQVDENHKIEFYIEQKSSGIVERGTLMYTGHKEDPASGEIALFGAANMQDYAYAPYEEFSPSDLFPNNGYDHSSAHYSLTLYRSPETQSDDPTGDGYILVYQNTGVIWFLQKVKE